MFSRSFYPLVVLSIFLLSLGLAGCGEKKAPSPGPGLDDQAAGPEEPLETPDPEPILEGRTTGPMLPVYFDFDSAEIRPDQMERLLGNADYLRTHPEIMVRIEGNCDPRGTQEYNLALGERRAQSARRVLVEQGIDPGRISTLSWGEEKLLLFGHDELSWAQNRRDDFVVVE